MSECQVLRGHPPHSLCRVRPCAWPTTCRVIANLALPSLSRGARVAPLSPLLPEPFGECEPLPSLQAEVGSSSWCSNRAAPHHDCHPLCLACSSRSVHPSWAPDWHGPRRSNPWTVSPRFSTRAGLPIRRTLVAPGNERSKLARGSAFSGDVEVPSDS